MVTGTDLFTTIAELAGLTLPEYKDSKSFKPLFSESSKTRDYLYSELNDGTNDSWAISNGPYKLIVNANGDEEFYYLSNDPYEQNNLLNGTLTPAESNAKMALETELGNIRQ